MLRQPVTSKHYVYPTSIGNLIIRLSAGYQQVYYFEVYGEDTLTYREQKYLVHGKVLYRPSTGVWKFSTIVDDISADDYSDVYENDFHIFPIGKWYSLENYSEISVYILQVMALWKEENPDIFKSIEATLNFK